MKEYEIIASMKAQMMPSAQARAELEEKLVRARGARPAVWRRYAAAAACAVLALAAWPVYRLANPRPVPGAEAHSYVFVERDAEHPAVKAPAGTEVGEPSSEPGAAPSVSTGEEQGPAETGRSTAVIQYDSFVGHLLGADGWIQCPDWYGGSDPYTDPDRLTIFFTEGYRTPELEEQITDWCGGGEVAFGSVKYSVNYLASLLEQVGSALDGKGVDCSCGFDESRSNCLRLDIYVPLTEEERAELLAIVARLDPDDDAICVRFFEDMTPVNETIVK